MLNLYLDKRERSLMLCIQAKDEGVQCIAMSRQDAVIIELERSSVIEPLWKGNVEGHVEWAPHNECERWQLG